jgi:hypothetical protein
MTSFAKLCAIAGILLCAVPLPYIVFQYLGSLGSTSIALGPLLSDSAILPFIGLGVTLYIVGIGLLRVFGIAPRAYFLLFTGVCYAPALSKDVYPFLIGTALALIALSIVATIRVARAA